MQRRHDPTFYWATRRLPPDVRPAVHALYGYVRGADEIVDGPRRHPDPAVRCARLDAWQAALQDGERDGRSAHPVVAALVDAGQRHALPLGELRVYMDSMRTDCRPVRIADREELDAYMNGSAASVGRIMAPLLGAPAERETVAALGVAFQLTNFIRDVREDWAMDRVYLPGLAEDDLSARPATTGVRERVAGEVARARALFAEGAVVLDAVTP
ncbi:MAG: squalene/phytoene synthase family protein, partial [Solirubrobacterales bacterium]|nr:squalene/phytoene synthase family protein [Solirubrobacterales bacterium]